MLSHLLSLYQQFQSVIKTNQVVAGAFSLWGLSVITYLARNIPSKIFNFVWHQMITSVSINNAGWWRNRAIFLAFCDWYKNNHGSTLSRTLSIDTTDDGKAMIGPGYGNHIFFWNRKLFWFNKARLDSSHGDTIKETITIYTFGRSRKPIEKLLRQFEKYHDDADKTKVFTAGNDDWDMNSKIVMRPLDSVIIPSQTKDHIVEQLTDFYSQRDWYLSKGLPHKLCILLHGKPGCGKTSLVKALAGHFNADVYTLSLSNVTDKSLPAFISSIPPGAFLLIEDFDTSPVVKSRENSITSLGESIQSAINPLTLSGILNALDGITSLDNLVIFMTTNHPESIDPALIRNGRKDLSFELKELENAEIKKYVKYVYEKDIDGEFKPIAGCDIQALLLEHKQDFDAFYSDLVEKYGVEKV